MANRTAGQVLSQVADATSRRTSIRSRRSGAGCSRRRDSVCEEILHETLGETFSDETELRVPPPYDASSTGFHLEAQIDDHANGETVRCNNASTAWNNAFLTYRDAYCRAQVPPRRVPALRLC